MTNFAHYEFDAADLVFLPSDFGLVEVRRVPEGVPVDNDSLRVEFAHGPVHWKSEFVQKTEDSEGNIHLYYMMKIV